VFVYQTVDTLLEFLGIVRKHWYFGG